MARRPGSFKSVAQPLQSLWSRFAFGVLVAGSFALLLLGKADLLLIERARLVLSDTMAPVMSVLSRPAATISDIVQTVQNFKDLKAQNDQLLVENARLERWQHVAQRLEAENRSLRALNAFVPPPSLRFVTARVIADASGPFVRSVTIGAGKRDGVVRGAAAISGEGLAGMVVEAGERHARVLLISDLNSMVPVMVERTRDPAVLAGNNTRAMTLVYLPQNAQVHPGDRIVTSGHGGVLPAGLPVGAVTAISDTEVKVTPFIDWDRLEYLRLLTRLEEDAEDVFKGVIPPFSVMGTNGPKQ